VPYNFALTTQLLNEVDLGFHTGSLRIYSPNVCVAQELLVDQLAKAMHRDPYQAAARTSASGRRSRQAWPRCSKAPSHRHGPAPLGSADETARLVSSAPRPKFMA
jgi:hypothetical protein